jgi:hypothetical protein
VVVAPQRRAVAHAGAREARVLPTDGGAPPELGRAVRLLAEGSQALEDARRIG